MEVFPQTQAEASATEAQSHKGASASLGAPRLGTAMKEEIASECGRNSLYPRGLTLFCSR